MPAPMTVEMERFIVRESQKNPDRIELGEYIHHIMTVIHETCQNAYYRLTGNHGYRTSDNDAQR